MTEAERAAFEAELQKMRRMIASVRDLADKLDAATEVAIKRLKETTP